VSIGAFFCYLTITAGSKAMNHLQNYLKCCCSIRSHIKVWKFYVLHKPLPATRLQEIPNKHQKFPVGKPNVRKVERILDYAKVAATKRLFDISNTFESRQNNAQQSRIIKTKDSVLLEAKLQSQGPKQKKEYTWLQPGGEYTPVE
jgi:hypothetical protein